MAMANVMRLWYGCCVIGKQEATRLDLRLELRRRGLTHRRVSQLLDKPESTVSNWSRGLTPRPDSQQRLVEILNDTGNFGRVTIEDLWGSR